MNCKKADIYIDALLDNELELKDSIEVVEHLENCSDCKSKWELNEETRSKLKHFIGSIKASNVLKNKIKNKLNNNSPSLVRFKPNLIAASIIFLLGLGLFFNETFSSVPPLDELHNNQEIQKVSYNIDEVSNHTGIKLNKSFFSGFKEYSLEGSSKIKKSLTKEATIVYLNNIKGDKISICFLPENYEMPECHSMQKNGVLFHCGNKGNCNYAYWKQNKKTIAVVANTLTSDEIIEMSVPLTEEI